MKTLAEQNKDSRLELSCYVTDPKGSWEDTVITTIENTTDHIAIYYRRNDDVEYMILLDETDFLRYHEMLINAYLHQQDTKERQKLNKIIEDLKV